MLGRHDGNRFFHRINADKINTDTTDTGKPLQNLLFTQMPQVKLNVFPQRMIETAAFVNFSLNAAGNDVSGSKFHGRGNVILHKPLALIVKKITSFSAAAFGHQDIRADKCCGMKLDELHVFQAHSGLISHANTASCINQSVGGIPVNPSVAASAEYGYFGANGN